MSAGFFLLVLLHMEIPDKSGGVVPGELTSSNLRVDVAVATQRPSSVLAQASEPVGARTRAWASKEEVSPNLMTLC